MNDDWHVCLNMRCLHHIPDAECLVGKKEMCAVMKETVINERQG